MEVIAEFAPQGEYIALRTRKASKIGMIEQNNPWYVPHEGELVQGTLEDELSRRHVDVYNAVSSSDDKSQVDSTFSGLEDPDNEMGFGCQVVPYTDLPAVSVRGEIKSFSVRSRSRLMKKLSMLRKHVLPVFVTLTYPASYPVEYKEYKYHVHKFFTYFFRRFDPDRQRIGIVWKLEYQSRGAAHFHMLIFGVTDVEIGEWVCETWYKIVGSGDINHLLWHKGLLGNKPCVEKVRSWHGVKSYASKYMGKLDERTENTGRFWGVRGALPLSPLLTIKIDVVAALAFRRAYRRYSGMRLYRFGFWGYGNVLEWLRFLYVISDGQSLDHVPESPPRWLEMSPSRFL